MKDDIKFTLDLRKMVRALAQCVTIENQDQHLGTLNTELIISLSLAMIEKMGESLIECASNEDVSAKLCLEFILHSNFKDLVRIETLIEDLKPH